MKKVGKIILIIVVILVSTVFIDFISLNISNKPFFVIKATATKYTGILYDTYNCPEHSWFTFKSKFTKFNCAVELKNEDKNDKKNEDKEFNKEIASIQDETIGRTDLAFAQALEKFYEDENFEYFYSCIKSNYITVTYKDGTKETVKDALAKGHITIKDVDNYKIHYYKEAK